MSRTSTQQPRVHVEFTADHMKALLRHGAIQVQHPVLPRTLAAAGSVRACACLRVDRPRVTGEGRCGHGGAQQVSLASMFLAPRLEGHPPTQRPQDTAGDRASALCLDRDGAAGTHRADCGQT